MEKEGRKEGKTNQTNGKVIVFAIRELITIVFVEYDLRRRKISIRLSMKRVSKYAPKKPKFIFSSRRCKIEFLVK
ncbi:hypothetical protein HY988_06650 [Candidatus Micrarchaeota archaeon]|nr:hypothetical protein [Candidatus Micrarchaeota archaeon]